MKGIIILCPSKDCRKMLLKNAHLRQGSYMTIKCFHCGYIISLNALAGQIEMRIDKKNGDMSGEKKDLTEDDEDDMIFLST